MKPHACRQLLVALRGGPVCIGLRLLALFNIENPYSNVLQESVSILGNPSNSPTYHIYHGWRVWLACCSWLLQLLEFLLLSRWVERLPLRDFHVHLTALEQLWVRQNLVRVRDESWKEGLASLEDIRRLETGEVWLLGGFGEETLYDLVGALLSLWTSLCFFHCGDLIIDWNNLSRRSGPLSDFNLDC